MPVNNYMLLNNYNCTLEILTPLHIGAGEEKNWIRGIDYVIRQNLMYVLDKASIYQDADEKEQATYLEHIAKGKFSELEKFIKETYQLKDYSQKTKIPIFANPGTEINTLNTLIRNGLNQPYIPGSSIKGAIRSALIYYLAKERKIPIPLDKNNRQRPDTLLGSFSSSIGRFIRISDAVLKNTEVHTIILFNLYQRRGEWESGYKPNFSIFAETFAPQATTTFRLSIAKGLVEKIEKIRQNQSLTQAYRTVFDSNQEHLKVLFGVINTYTQQHLRREIAFFNHFNEANNVDLIIENLKRIQQQIPKDNSSCVLRMAAGSGFHAITGEWSDKSEDHVNIVSASNRKIKYKSRKIVEHNYQPLGFVKISPQQSK